MKKCLLFAVLFFSCTNPKVRIVEEEKQIDNERARLRHEQDSINYIANHKYKRTGDKVEWDSFGFSDTHLLWGRFEDTIVKLGDKYDSLEMELKKY